MTNLQRRLTTLFCLIAGLAAALPPGAAALAQSQLPAPIADEAPILVCYQNGRQIFQIGPLDSISQAGGEAYLAFQHQDGSRGQVRIIGTAVCLVTAHPPAPSAKK